MSGTWEALKRAERDRQQAETAKSDAVVQLGEDIAALQVAVHSLEDRVELEMGGLSDELRQAIRKAEDLAASRGSAAEERMRAEIGWLANGFERVERRTNAFAALAGLAVLVLLFRC